MKKSLLSKILAGAMSLGMISGGASMQNVCAMKLEDEDDDQYQDYYFEKTKPSNVGRNNVGREDNKVVRAATDLVPFFGPTLAHALLGTPSEDLMARITAITTLLAMHVAAKNSAIFLTEKEHNVQKFREIIKEIDKGTNVNTDENGNAVDEEGNVVIPKTQLALLLKNGKVKKNDQGDIVNEKGTVLVSKDKLALLTSGSIKMCATALSPLVLYHLGWFLYDINR